MKGSMRKKSANEHIHSASFYQPEFNIGDSVFIWGTVDEIKIDANGVWYTVLLQNTDETTSVFPVTIHCAEVFSTGMKMNGGEGIK